MTISGLTAGMSPSWRRRVSPCRRGLTCWRDPDNRAANVCKLRRGCLALLHDDVLPQSMHVSSHSPLL